MRPVEEISQTTGFYRSDVLYHGFHKPKPRLLKILHKASKAKCKIIRTSFGELKKLTEIENHQGVLLKRIENYPLKTLALEDILEADSGLYILIDRLNDAQNLGSIVRSAAAFGAKAILLNKKKTPPLGQTVWKVSSGALAHVPVFQMSSTTTFLKQLRLSYPRDSHFLLGADLNGEVLTANLLKTIDLKKRKLFLLLGEEERGIGKHLLSELDMVVKILQRGSIDSLNVGVAAGILLYIASLAYSETNSDYSDKSLPATDQLSLSTSSITT